MKKYWCAANWKLHKTPDEASAFVRALRGEYFSACQIVLYPQNFSCPIVAEEIGIHDAIWGAQNIYPQSFGPYTGENSPTILKALGAKTVLIGHSERRVLFQETDDLIAQKMRASVQAGLVPLLCVGESQEEHQLNQSKEVVARQIQKGLSLVESDAEFAIAYEPVWAIGSGKTATLDVIEDMHAFIQSLMSRHTPVLYGGSVKPENAKVLAVGENIDGFLVGGASLEVSSFLAIAKALEECKLNI